MPSTLNIWGREFSLPIEYEIVDEKGITIKQKETLVNFINNVPKCLRETVDIVDYCRKSNPDELDSEINNIFKYVIPTALFVGENKVSVMCNYKFDIEHGIAMVIKDGLLDKICTQDEI